MAAYQTVDYRFYSKPCSGPYLMMRDSAMPARTKMASLTQEVIRHLRNTSASLAGEDLQAPILTLFRRRMAISGYGEGYRKKVFTAGVPGFEGNLEASQSGERPLF